MLTIHDLDRLCKTQHPPVLWSVYGTDNQKGYRAALTGGPKGINWWDDRAKLDDIVAFACEVMKRLSTK